MLTDLNDLESGRSVEADLVVVGAGAAGIALALEFAGSQHRVLLAESGGIEADAETLALGEGSVVGLPYEPLESSRARWFGGTTNMWSGWCKPLDPADLRPRPWLGMSGWPLGRAELEPLYRRAQEVVEAGSYRYDLAQWLETAGEVDDMAAVGIEQTFWQKSPPTRFGERYLERLRGADNITVLLNANLTSLRIDEHGVVDTVELRSLRGRAAQVAARCVVIACGGLENPRLLLAAAPARPEGLGNQSDLVGRCFMEHPWFEAATILPSDSYTLVDRYFRHMSAGHLQRAGWQFTPAEQERLGVLNCNVGLGIGSYRQGGIQAARRLWRDLVRGSVPDALAEDVIAILGDLGTLSESLVRKTILDRRVNRPPETLTLNVVLDPQPNPSSRVTLSDERDALGMPRIQLDWRLTAEDERSMTLLVRRVADELTRLGHGRVRLQPALQDPSGGWARAGNLVGHGDTPDLPAMHISWHHMGTTRMAASPRDGVVDPDCRVHGTANLFVAGSSVFPTGGNANPTLTIVALALRLADRLKAVDLAPGLASIDSPPARGVAPQAGAKQPASVGAGG